MNIICLAFFLFAEVYFYSLGRPFDYLAIGLLFLSALVIKNNNATRIYVRFIAPTAFLIMPWVVLGLLSGHVLAASAFLIGVILVFPLGLALAENIGMDLISESIYYVLILSTGLFYLQLSIYYVFGVYLDFSSYLGDITSRGYNTSLDYFRPHGIFQEPNAYCTITFCLLALCPFLSKRRHGVESLAIFSLAASLSVWGAAASIMMFLLLKRKFIIHPVVLSVFLFILLVTFGPGYDVSGMIERSITLSRIVNIQEDASFGARLGEGRLFYATFNPSFLLGHGINTSDFQAAFGANGVSFLIYSFGLIGAVLLFMIFCWLVMFDHRIILSMAFLLTTYPPFSYMYFWFWLALLVALKQYCAVHVQGAQVTV
jgi:hypothetical protein